MPSTVLRGGTVVAPQSGQLTKADVLVVDDRVAKVGVVAAEEAEQVLDCSDRLVMPGMMDTHSHAEARVFDDEVAQALLRQGVTSVIGGQDGVSFAPGDGSYSSRYFAAINGPHPHYRDGGVGALLATYSGRSAVNVGYLVPAGTVRELVSGLSAERPSKSQLSEMQELVAEGMRQGALGLSTGLDYLPGCFADAAEIAALCAPVVADDGLYVTHMRGGYEEKSAVGLAEVAEICRLSGVRAHISHFHARPELVAELVADLQAQGVDITFDSYPYSRGSTILAMLMLPPEFLGQGFDRCAEELSRPEVQAAVIDSWLPVLQARADMGEAWADHITFGHIAAPAYDWAHGLTLRAAAQRAGQQPAPFALQVLAASALEVGVIMRVPRERTDADMARQLTHPAHMGGSDGIFIGKQPHPRAWGAFARYLAVFAAERGDLSWVDAARAFAYRPAQRFGLPDRGSIAVGRFADLIVVDPQALRVNADYPDPRRLADGVADVFVNGQQVLSGGQLTGIRAGRGLSRGR